MHQCTGPSLVCITVCHLLGAKPLSIPIPIYCQSDCKEQTSVKFGSKYSTCEIVAISYHPHYSKKELFPVEKVYLFESILKSITHIRHNRPEMVLPYEYCKNFTIKVIPHLFYMTFTDVWKWHLAFQLVRQAIIWFQPLHHSGYWTGVSGRWPSHKLGCINTKSILL